MKNLKLLLLILPVIVLAGCSSNPEYSKAQDLKDTVSAGDIVIINNNIDLGDIPIMGGKIDAVFRFKNNSNEEIALYEAETSCMCTEAVVKSDNGTLSPKIKMGGHGAIVNVNQVLGAGEESTLLVTFDPLAHGPNATGPIKRDVIIKTNSKTTPEIRFSFLGNVIPGDKIKKVPKTFDFAETSYDFGMIKQSGGKVSHEFEFTYNGDEPIKITGVPTSCACTIAEVSPTNLEPGDTGILTVRFNPNLHEEPEGKFFKTVAILTEPSLIEISEVKIWVEIDLDLGPEAFELKSSHNDDEDETHEEPEYKSITPEVFHGMLQQKDFVLIDTHIPEQTHIENTDSFIPYNDIIHASDLPKDKDTKIVLYCRSGSMSRAAAYQLAEEGYTNVYDLVGGKNAYDNFLIK